MTRRKLYQGMVLVGFLAILAGLTVSLAPERQYPLAGAALCGVGLLAFSQARAGWRTDAKEQDKPLSRAVSPLLAGACVAGVDLLLFGIGWFVKLQTTPLGIVVLAGVAGVFVATLVVAFRWTR